MTTMKSLSLKSLILSVGLMSVAVACGGGGDGGGGNTTTNPAAATSTVTSTSSLQTAIGDMNGNSASTALNGIGSSAQGIVTMSSPQTGALIQLQDVIRQIHTTGAVAANAPGDCICDASGNCTFDMCGGSGFLMSGTITNSAGTYTIDVTMELNYGGVDYDWEYTGEVTMTDVLIDGHLAGNGTGVIDAQGMTFTYNFDWDVTYNMIGLDPTGCAISGSMDASVSYSVDGVSGGNFSGDATVTFGPTCGAATAS